MLYTKESFTVANIAVMVESGEWDRADLCLEPPDDHGCDSAEDSGDEDFGGLCCTIFTSFSHLDLKCLIGS